MVNSEINTLKQYIQNRKDILPFDVLTRALSSITFYPRDISLNLPEKNIFIIQINRNQPLETIIHGIKDKQNIVAVATDYIDMVAMLRRYSKLAIINHIPIIDKYQILESLIYGADYIVFDLKITGVNIVKKMSKFARNLGLKIILRLHCFKDKIKAMFIDCDFLMIDYKDIKSLKKVIFMANNDKKAKKIILKSHLNDIKQDIDELNRAGINIFLITNSEIKDI